MKKDWLKELESRRFYFNEQFQWTLKAELFRRACGTDLAPM